MLSCELVAFGIQIRPGDLGVDRLDTPVRLEVSDGIPETRKLGILGDPVSKARTERLAVYEAESALGQALVCDQRLPIMGCELGFQVGLGH